MSRPKFPNGWDEKRVAALIDHYENQTADEAVAEDEATLADLTQTVIEVPSERVPAVRDLSAKKTGAA